MFSINSMKIKIGISGIGFVGSAMMNSFIKKGYELNKNLFVYDKYKEKCNDINCLLQTDIVFLALPTLYNEDIKAYDTLPLDDNLRFLKDSSYEGLVVIKSTLGPDTCSNFASNSLSKSPSDISFSMLSQFFAHIKYPDGKSENLYIQNPHYLVRNII